MKKNLAILTGILLSSVLIIFFIQVKVNLPEKGKREKINKPVATKEIKSFDGEKKSYSQMISYESSVFAPIITEIKIPEEIFLGDVISAKISFTFLNDITYIFGKEDLSTENGFVKKWLRDIQWDKDIPRYIKIQLYSRGNEINAGEEEFCFEMMKGETRNITVDLDVKSTPVTLKGVIRWYFSDKYKGPYLAAPVKGFELVILNKNTGQLGTKKEVEELLKKLPEYTYDIVLGKRETEWKPCSQEEVDRIRETLPNEFLGELIKIQGDMEELQKLDTTISDIEALDMLHDIEYEMLVRYGISMKEEARDILIKARELSKRSGLSKWKAVEKVSGKKSLLDENDNENNNPDSKSDDKSDKSRVDVTLEGVFLYKKHLFDTTGLDTNTVDKNFGRTRVRIWGYWPGQGLTNFPTWTDSTGKFSKLIGGVTFPARFCPMIYLRGPGLVPEWNRVKVNSDTINFSYPEIGDTTLWRFKWHKWDTVSTSYYNFGNSYVAQNPDDGGIFPDSRQPRSGAANIYNMILDSYEYLVDSFTTADTIGKVQVIWQPGYSHASGYKNDTIFIVGDTLFPPGRWNTDEWDDIVILHEYGHHAMAQHAELPCAGASHYWHAGDSTTMDLAYMEGWAHFFTCYIQDSTWLVNTYGSIGTPHAEYMSIENPWIGSQFTPDMFDGGPGCEGAVAGVLWDIRDAQDEIPYPSYPTPGFPDTALSDTLSLGLSNIWNIFDDYIFTDTTSHNIYTILQFLSGWGYYNYDHTFGLNQILLHHRIPWDVPSAPTGLDAKVDSFSPEVDLTWYANSETDIMGYNIYRAMIPNQMSKINGSLVSDTTYVDSTVFAGKSFYYRVTAVDSLNYESDYSNPDTVIIPYYWLYLSGDQGAAFGKKIALSSSSKQGEADTIYCGKSSNCGLWWDIEEVGVGEHPSIALDSNNKPNLVWMWYAPPMQVAKSILYFARDTGSNWTDPDTLWEYPANSGIPCFQIDNDDTGHVSWNSFPQFGNGIRSGSELKYGYFSTQTTSPTFNDTTIDEDATDPGIEIPSLAIDSIYYNAHVAYTKDGNIYYTKINKTSWTRPRRISDNSDSSANPNIEFDKGSNKLHIVWQQQKNGKYQIMHTAASIGARWPNPIVACSTGYNSVNPVITSGEFIFWSEEITNNSEIYYSRYSGSSWGTPTLVKNTTEDSKYPHAIHVPSADSDTVFVAWTDGDSMPYIIEFKELNFAKQQNLFSGHITKNTTWSDDITIGGDVWIDWGVTLTINPGVQVKFVPNHDKVHGGIDPERAEFIVLGELKIIDNDSMPVIFTSNASRPKSGDWYGIRFISNEKKETEKRKKHVISGKSNLVRKRDKALEDKENSKEMNKRKVKEEARKIQSIRNLRIENANIGILFDRETNTIISECEFLSNKTGIKISKNAAVDIIDCNFTRNVRR
jgi:uncharacterized protein (DUF2384 family)